MSCYEWENGTIVLPTKIFAKFRRQYIDGWNEIQEMKLAKLKTWRETALRDGKGKRNYSFKDRMLCMASNWYDEQLIEMLFDDNRKPKMPTKKMFSFANGRDFAFDLGEAGIGFSKKEHSVTWSVFENNHACDTAKVLPESHLLFIMLGEVEWTRGSGGVIVGNDEYNRDDYNEGGGGNYVKMTFGKQKERRSHF